MTVVPVKFAELQPLDAQAEWKTAKASQLVETDL
jgi:hypothetical protein